MNKQDFLALCAAYYEKNGDLIPSGFKEPSAQAFYRSETVGGLSGGNCWNSNSPQPYRVDVEDPGIGKLLDGFLERYLPNVSFLKYRKVASKVRVHEHTEYEYYGNRSEYRIWELTFEDLWDVLAEDLAPIEAE